MYFLLHGLDYMMASLLASYYTSSRWFGDEQPPPTKKAMVGHVIQYNFRVSNLYDYSHAIMFSHFMSIALGSKMMSLGELILYMCLFFS